MPRVSSGGIGAGGSPCARRAGAVFPMILEHNGSLTSLRAERAEGCEMANMSAGDLKALLSAERYDALSAMAASKLSDERASALNYYMGNMSKDMPAPDGRSKAISSDVANTIEGLMPPLMEIFAAGEEVVQFAPVGPEDVAAAEQETDYVNHVFMQQNPGFLVLYSFIKDALLSKVGVVKVWWECRQEVERETYLDQPDDAFALSPKPNPGLSGFGHSLLISGRKRTSPQPAGGGESSGAHRAENNTAFAAARNERNRPFRDGHHIGQSHRTVYCCRSEGFELLHVRVEPTAERGEHARPVRLPLPPPH